MIVKAESYYTQRYTQFEECTRQGSLTHSLRFAQGAALEPHWGSIHSCPRFDPPTGYQQKSHPYGWLVGTR